MELSTGILSGYIILNCWGRTNLVSMQLWQSLWWLFPPYLSFSRSTRVVSRWILESEPLVWMMYTKCYFFPHHCISWLWKIIDKRRGCIVQRFFYHLSWIGQNVSRVWCSITTEIRPSLKAMEERLLQVAVSQSTHTCATWSWGCPGTGTVLERGKDVTWSVRFKRSTFYA